MKMENEEGIIGEVKRHLEAGRKQKAVEAVANTLKKAIKEKNTKVEQQLLWMTVAILEHDNANYNDASEQHTEVTKLSELYALIEELGRMRYPRMMQLMGR